MIMKMRVMMIALFPGAVMPYLKHLGGRDDVVMKS